MLRAAVQVGFSTLNSQLEASSFFSPRARAFVSQFSRSFPPPKSSTCFLLPVTFSRRGKSPVHNNNDGGSVLSHVCTYKETPADMARAPLNACAFPSCLSVCVRSSPFLSAFPAFRSFRRWRSEAGWLRVAPTATPDRTLHPATACECPHIYFCRVISRFQPYFEWPSASASSVCASVRALTPSPLVASSWRP